MDVIWFSKTGNIQRFVSKLDIPGVNFFDGNSVSPIEKFILITYTTGMGEVPEEVRSFLSGNHKNMVGVVSSGNKNWGSYYGKASEEISRSYSVPFMKFEMSGTKEDVKRFKGFIEDLSK